MTPLTTLTTPALNLSDAKLSLAQPLPTSRVDEATRTQLKEKAQEFEQFFIRQFISLMSPEPDVNAPFFGGAGEKMFRSELHDKLAEAITTRGGFGVAQSVYTELLRQQEAATM